MNIAIPSLPVFGHLLPMLALARALERRGHKVTLFSTPDAKTIVHNTGIRFVSLGTKQFPAGIMARVARKLGASSGNEGLQITIHVIAALTGAMIRPLEEVLGSGEFRGVVFDDVQFYLELAAIRLNLPYVHVANALPIDLSGLTPLCFFPWSQDLTHSGRTRNLAGLSQMYDWLEPSREIGSRYADEVGLAIEWSDNAANRAGRTVVAQLPSGFDFEPPPPNLFHTGPFIDPLIRPAIPFDYTRLDSRPLVFVSMGTLQVGLAFVFQTIIDVARERSNLLFLIVVGNQIQPETLDAPSNVVKVEAAPQLNLLERAALCITHAGLNTTLEAISKGVPLVAIPITNDQPGVAARIRWFGVGDYVPLRELTAERLGQLVDRVLFDRTFAAQAREIARQLANDSGADRAASIIERTLFNAPSKV